MSVRDRCWVHVTWCDDIRNEVGNKPSFMGVYTAGLVVPALPTIIPRMGVFVQVYRPAAQRPKSLTLSIKRSDGLVLAQAEIPQEELDRRLDEAALAEEEREAEDIPPMRVMHFAALLGNIELLPETKHLRAFVEVDGELIPSFRLTVAAAQQPSAEHAEDVR